MATGFFCKTVGLTGSGLGIPESQKYVECS